MQEDKENRIYFWMGILLLFCGIAYLAIDKYFFKVFLPNSECIFYRMLGLYCPGCGGTRAVHALLKGHFLESLRYHIAVPFTAILYVYYMGSNAIHFFFRKIKAMRFRELYLWMVLILVVANFLIRNVLLLFFQITI